ncbi:MAG: Holliday junction resolvase-like protein [Candidatus Bathyarchaeia archaeon]|jgi:predicted Holliday junction resolvase-like endonuclease
MSAGFVDSFQDLRTILCVCPCCGELVRASELHLSLHGKAPKTWLDDYEAELHRLEDREDEFEANAAEVKQAAIERGRKKVVERACSCLDSSIACFNYDPYDIKALFHPVDFVVFNGLNAGEDLDDITFLTRQRRGDLIQKSVAKAIKNGKYNWKVARVTEDGGVDYE